MNCKTWLFSGGRSFTRNCKYYKTIVLYSSYVRVLVVSSFYLCWRVVQRSWFCCLYRIWHFCDIFTSSLLDMQRRAAPTSEESGMHSTVRFSIKTSITNLNRHMKVHSTQTAIWLCFGNHVYYCVLWSCINSFSTILILYVISWNEPAGHPTHLPTRIANTGHSIVF